MKKDLVLLFLMMEKRKFFFIFLLLKIKLEDRKLVTLLIMTRLVIPKIG